MATSRSEYMKRRRLNRKAVGLCTKCPRRAKPGSSRCEKCTEQHRVSTASRTHRGICISCLNPAESGTARCIPCNTNFKATSIQSRNCDLQEALSRYGGRCAVCRESNPIFLTIDHIHGGGKKHRIAIGRIPIQRWLRQHGYPAGFQILCWNHNHLKHRSLVQSPPTDAARRIRESNFRLKIETFEAYGGSTCRCCGNAELEALTLDHVNGGGEADRRTRNTTSGSNFYRVLRQGGYPSGFQVLCFNCNCGRARNGGVCPHSHTS